MTTNHAALVARSSRHEHELPVVEIVGSSCQFRRAPTVRSAAVVLLIGEPPADLRLVFLVPSANLNTLHSEPVRLKYLNEGVGGGWGWGWGGCKGVGGVWRGGYKAQGEEESAEGGDMKKA